MKRFGEAAHASSARAAHGTERSRTQTAQGRHARDAVTNEKWHKDVAASVPNAEVAKRDAEGRGKLHSAKQRAVALVYAKILHAIDQLWSLHESSIRMPIVLLGWGAGRNARWLGRSPPSHWRLAQRLAARGVLVVGVDEFLTSKVSGKRGEQGRGRWNEDAVERWCRSVCVLTAPPTTA